MITVLFPQSSFVMMYSGLPFFMYRDPRFFRLVSSLQGIGEKDPNRILILLRWLNSDNAEAPLDPVSFLKSLRDHYDKIVLFDDDDSSSTPYAALLPYVDQFWKKQLFRDRALYCQRFYGDRVFSDFYHRQFGVEQDTSVPYPLVENPEDLAKFRLGWGLGIGSYPLRHWRERAAEVLYPWLGRSVTGLFAQKAQADGAFFHSKEPFCQARFAEQGYSPSIGFQRRVFSQKLQHQPGVRYGFTSRKEYRLEMKTAFAVVSPFGWGEVCYRDFEAIRAGSVIIKPSMEHLETWPDTYQPFETYVPVAWDAEDLLETINRVLGDRPHAVQMIQNALDTWVDGFRNLDARVEHLIKDLL